jgi:hypothetical protein
VILFPEHRPMGACQGEAQVGRSTSECAAPTKGPLMTATVPQRSPWATAREMRLFAGLYWRVGLILAAAASLTIKVGLLQVALSVLAIVTGIGLVAVSVLAWGRNRVKQALAHGQPPTTTAGLTLQTIRDRGGLPQATPRPGSNEALLLGLLNVTRSGLEWTPRPRAARALGPDFRPLTWPFAEVTDLSFSPSRRCGQPSAFP